MLNKKFRLSKLDFLNQKRGEKIITPFFSIKIIENFKKEDSSKLGVIISNKFIKKANKRNVLKRKICYAYLELLKIKNNFNFLQNKTIVINLIKKNKTRENLLGENFNNYKEIKKQIQSICGTN